MLQSLEPGIDYTFDFSSIKFTGPFGLVYVATCMEDAAIRLQPCRLRARGHLTHGYLSHMGFFRTFGLNHGNLPGEAKGSFHYHPITEIDCLEIKRESAQSGVAIGELVEGRSQKLAEVLSHRKSGDVHDTLAFCIREILRNAVEHSHSKHLRFAAQYWPTRDRVELAVLDHGRGIKEALSTNPFIKPKTDREALNYALLPGVSGTAFKGSRINRKDVWGNSGFGLYMTNRICRMGGDFFIGSRDASVFLSPAKKDYFGFRFDGTVLRLAIKPSRVRNLKDRLREFSAEGSRIAAQMYGSVINASAASQMVTSDFSRSEKG